MIEFALNIHCFQTFGKSKVEGGFYLHYQSVPNCIDIGDEDPPFFFKENKSPFTLSLSKGGCPSRSCFDRLSTNGLIVEECVFSIMDSLVRIGCF